MRAIDVNRSFHILEHLRVAENDWYFAILLLFFALFLFFALDLRLGELLLALGDLLRIFFLDH